MLTMRPAPEATRCGIAAREAFSAVSHVDRVKVLPGFRVAVGDGLEREGAGDIDEGVEPAEMRGRRVDGLQGLRRVGQIDAAEIDPVRRGAGFRGSPVDAGHSGAARDGGGRDHLAQRAGGSGDDDGFSVHEGPPGRNGCK